MANRRTFRGVLPLGRAMGRAPTGRAVSSPIDPSNFWVPREFSSARSNLAIFFASDDLSDCDGLCPIAAPTRDEASRRADICSVRGEPSGVKSGVLRASCSI